MSQPDPVTLMKQYVGKAAADRVQSGTIVGLGTGSTTAYAIQYIGERLQSGELKDIKPALKALKELPEILAIEFLNKKNVFGVKATIKEMSRFKPKIKKQEVVYDPELEKKKVDLENLGKIPTT